MAFADDARVVGVAASVVNFAIAPVIAVTNSSSAPRDQRVVRRDAGLPALKSLPIAIFGAIESNAPSASTITGDLPPARSVTGVGFFAAACAAGGQPPWTR
jgi:hypothetical protein